MGVQAIHVGFDREYLSTCVELRACLEQSQLYDPLGCMSMHTSKRGNDGGDGRQKLLKLAGAQPRKDQLSIRLRRLKGQQLAASWDSLL